MISGDIPPALGGFLTAGGRRLSEVVDHALIELPAVRRAMAWLDDQAAFTTADAAHRSARALRGIGGGLTGLADRLEAATLPRARDAGLRRFPAGPPTGRGRQPHPSG